MQMIDGNFSQFGVQEKQLSDVEGVQAPVVDKSSVVEGAALTEGVSNLVSMGVSAFNTASQKSALEEQTKAKKSFEKNLLSAQTLADKHGSESVLFKTYLTGSFQGSELDFDTKTKMLKDFESTVLGKTFTTLSPEEKGFRAQRKAAVEAGYVFDWMSEEQQDAGQLSYQNSLAQGIAIEQDLANWKRENFREGMSPEQLAVYDRKLADKNYAALSNMVVLEREPAKNFIKQVQLGLEGGELNAADAQALIKEKRGEMNALLGQLQRGVSKADVEALVKPYFDLFDEALITSDSATTRANLENQVAINEAQTTLNLTLEHPKLVEYASLTSLVGKNNPVLNAKVGVETVKLLKGMSEDKKAPDVTQASDDSAAYFEVLVDNIKSVGDVDVRGNLVVDPEELLVQADGVIRSGARFMDEDDSPNENQKYIEFLARDDLGSYLGENYGRLSTEARTKLEDVLIKNAKNYVYPATQDLISSELKVEGKRFGVDEGDIEMSGEGGRVLFSATTSDPWTQSVAKKLNREVGGALSTYFKAVSNLSGEDFSAIYEREVAQIWPSKYGEEPAQEETTPAVDFSQYEGQGGTDAAGNRFIIRNGLPVKVGGDSDGG
jgi:hypothetical protein